MAEINGTDGDDYLEGGSGPDRIRGGRGRDVIFAWGGDDELFGDEADDYLVGGIGNDRLYGGDGADEIGGLEGDDVLRGEAGEDILRGGSGNDDIEGSDGNDQIDGDGFVSSIYGDGNDRIDGGQGNDAIRGGGGNDILVGGTENDHLKGGAGEDYLDAGAGDDYLSGFGEESYGFDEHRDTLLAGEGDDHLTVGYGDTVDGGAGVDTMYLAIYGGAAGGVTADLRQLANNGTITIGGATITGIEYVTGISLTQHDDKVIAGAIPPGLDGISMDGWGGNDELTGTAAVDNIYGGDGDDIIRGGGGLNPAYSPSGDRLRGEAGNDVIHIGQHDAEASGGDGNDIIHGGAGTDSIYGDSGSDRLSGAGGNDGIRGGWGADTIDGGDGSDLLDGGDGDDRLDGGTGADRMDGGEGFDIFVVDDAGDQVVDGEGLGLVETSLESYILPLFLDNLAGTYSGPDGGQTLRGNSLANRILGSAGNDVISGLDGDDLLAGGAGDDGLTGGSGRDLLVGGALSGTELIINGSFETEDGSNSSEAFIRASGTYENGFASRKTQTLFGWQSATASPIELAIENYNTAFAAGDGAAAIDLESGAGENQSLFQDISGIPAGTLLVLNFTAAKAITSWFSTTSSATAVMEVLWNGVVVATITPQTIYMQQYSLVVAAAASGTGAGGANRLEFRELGAGSDGRGTMLDSVSLRAVADAAADMPNGGDTADYSQETGTGNVLVNLQSVAVSDPSGQMLGARQALDSHGAPDSLWGIENVKTGAGDDRVYGDESANRIETGAGSDSLSGGAGNDVLIAGAGADFVDGGDGSDIVSGGDGGDTLHGGEGDDLLTGGSGVDSFDGGADPGGLGDRISFFESRATQGVVADLRTGIILNDGFGNVETMAGIESFGPDTAFADTFYGNDNRNGLIVGRGDFAYGFGGDDRIEAGLAAAVVDGGSGTDALFLRSSGGFLLPDSDGNGEAEFSPAMTVGWKVDLTAGTARDGFGNEGSVAGIEDLVGSGLADDLRGSAGDNRIEGAAGADILRLHDGGDDTVLAGAGNDNIFFIGSLTASDVVNGGEGVDTLVLQGPYGSLTLSANVTEIENISILGGNNTNFGEPGTNRHDYVLTVHDSNFAAGVQARINGAALLDDEDFTFDGSAETNAHFVIYGGKGKDTLTGGLGNDIFFFAEERFASGDVVNGGAGYNGMFLRGNYTIDFNAPGYTGLFTNIHNLTLTSATDERYARGGGTEFDYDLTLSNAIVNAGQTLTVSGALLLASETMVLDASQEADGLLRLFGGKANDTLKGGGQNDLLHGSLGADILTGNGGADAFRYQDTAESNLASMDQILDFTAGTDKIELDRIDADTNAAGNQAFSWIGSNAFSGSAGQLRAYEQNGTWFVEGDTDGDGNADLVIALTLQGATPLSAGDFLL